MEFIQEISSKFVFLEWLKPSKKFFLESILQRILNSKRLLADHIELLEQCHATQIDYIECSSRKKLFHLTTGLVLSSLAVASLKINLRCLHILVPTIATTYGVYVSTLTLVRLKNKLTQYRLNDTLSSIDMVDAAIRKNISYLRESKLLTDPVIIKRRCSQTDICLKSIAEIIRIVYDETRRLESILLPNHIESMYEPLEELTTCIYFQRSIEEFSCDDIKAFYNIFLYFQSQFLTRLCLIVCYAQQSGLRYLNEESIRLRQNLRTNTESLGIWLNENMCQRRRPDANWQENRAKCDAIAVTDIFKMKRSSMDVLCRLIAATNQYQNTDQRIQMLDMNANQQQLLDILNEMHRVNESLCGCQTDFETLKLIYTKCLMKKVELPVEDVQNRTQNECVPSNDELNITSDMKEKNHGEEESREYFAMRDIKNEEDSDSDDENQNGPTTRFQWYDKWDNIDMKVTRSFFAPVLKQLKTKIDPIKEQMKERELKYLMSHGIDREKIIKFDTTYENLLQERNNGTDTESDGGSISEDDHFKAAKTMHQANRYDEMRSFLEQKQQIQFLPLDDLPPPVSGSEDVIE